MNLIIKYNLGTGALKTILFGFIFFLFTFERAQALSAVKLYYQSEDYLNAIIIKKMFMDQGIPSEFIKIEQNKEPCLEKIKNETLLSICIDQSQNLEILDFKKNLFFDQIGPFLRGDR